MNPALCVVKRVVWNAFSLGVPDGGEKKRGLKQQRPGSLWKQMICLRKFMVDKVVVVQNPRCEPGKLGNDCRSCRYQGRAYCCSIQ